MWEAYEMDNEDFLWAGIPFMGGIASQQKAPCGAVSASAIALGLRHRCPSTDKEKAKHSRNVARLQAGQLVKEFNDKFGDISCLGLLGLDFSKPGGYQQFRESGIWKDKCLKYVEFIVEKLYEFEEERDDD